MDGDSAAARDFHIDVGTGTNIWLRTKDNTSFLGTFPPLTNTWFHVVAVADNNNTNVLKIWINGQLIGTSPSLGNANGCRTNQFRESKW